MLFSFILPLACILSIAIGFSVFFKERIEDTIALSVGSIVLFLYTASILTNGSLGIALIYILYFISAVILAASAIYVIRFSRKAIENLITPGLLVFLIGLAVFAVGCLNTKLIYYDEFTHWGLTVKNMYFLDKLSALPASTTDFKSYPPGTALFQYFFVKPQETFNEGSLIFAYNVMMLAFLLPIFKVVEWKNIKNGILIGLIVFLCPLVNAVTAWETILVDVLLGVIFCGTMAAHFFVRGGTHKLSIFSCICIGNAAMISTLVKDSGDVLMMIALLTIAVDVVLSPKQCGKRRKIIYISVPVLMFIAVKLSWKVFLLINHVPNSWNMGAITLEGIFRLISGNEEPWRYDVFIALANMLARRSNAAEALIPVSYLLWLPIWYYITSRTILLVPQEERNTLKRTTQLLSIGYCGYIFSLALMYCYVFSKGEGLMLASFPRYTGCYCIGATTFIVLRHIYCLFDDLKDLKYKVRLNTGRESAVLLILIGLLSIAPTAELTKRIIVPYQSSQEPFIERRQYCASENLEHVLDAEQDRVYIVDQNDFAHVWWIHHFNFAPIHTNKWKTWLVSSCEKWEEELLNGDFTHVFLSSIDEEFIEECGALFKGFTPEIDGLYRVERTEQGIQIIGE